MKEIIAKKRINGSSTTENQSKGNEREERVTSAGISTDSFLLR